MALVWQCSYQGNHYQVRTAGRSIRLYRNKVFHTQYHPERIVTGDIWELLLLASLNLPANAKVLLLGAGGGAVINLLNHFEQPALLEVVDLDGKMLEIAQQFFLTMTDNLKFHEVDALNFVIHKRNLKRVPKFDLIIDDAFYENQGEPCRAIEFNEQWLELLSGLLTEKGRLVFNFESSKSQSEALSNNCKKAINSHGFTTAIRFSSPRYQNLIFMLSRQALTTQDFRIRINTDPLLRKHNQSYFFRKQDL